MLNIKTLKNVLVTDERKDGFCFRSSCSQTLSQSQLASESASLSVTAGKTLRTHGRNLSFDITDENQGMFLENESGLTRLSVYNRRGTNVVAPNPHQPCRRKLQREHCHQAGQHLLYREHQFKGSDSPKMVVHYCYKNFSQITLLCNIHVC